MEISDYASAMARTVPGTFVPDIPAGAPKIDPLPDGAAQSAGAAADGAPTLSFKDTVKRFLSDVNEKLDGSDANARDFATGRTNDLGKVVTSAEEANLAMQFTLSMRNKLLQAYQEIKQIQM